MGKVIVAAALILAAAGYINGQAGVPAKPAAHSPSAKTAPKPALSDSQIEANIRAKFARSKISVDRFTVKVQNGVATIEGRTEVIQHKGVATRLAKNGGAIAVNNRIEISEASRKRAADRLHQGQSLRHAEIAKAAK